MNQSLFFETALFSFSDAPGEGEKRDAGQDRGQPREGRGGITGSGDVRLFGGQGGKAGSSAARKTPGTVLGGIVSKRTVPGDISGLLYGHRYPVA